MITITGPADTFRRAVDVFGAVYKGVTYLDSIKAFIRDEKLVSVLDLEGVLMYEAEISGLTIDNPDEADFALFDTKWLAKTLKDNFKDADEFRLELEDERHRLVGFKDGVKYKESRHKPYAWDKSTGKPTLEDFTAGRVKFNKKGLFVMGGLEPDTFVIMDSSLLDSVLKDQEKEGASKTFYFHFDPKGDSWCSIGDIIDASNNPVCTILTGAKVKGAGCDVLFQATIQNLIALLNGKVKIACADNFPASFFNDDKIAKLKLYIAPKIVQT